MVNNELVSDKYIWTLDVLYDGNPRKYRKKVLSEACIREDCVPHVQAAPFYCEDNCTPDTTRTLAHSNLHANYRCHNSCPWLTAIDLVPCIRGSFHHRRMYLLCILRTRWTLKGFHLENLLGRITYVSSLLDHRPCPFITAISSSLLVSPLSSSNHYHCLK